MPQASWDDNNSCRQYGVIICHIFTDARVSFCWHQNATVRRLRAGLQHLFSYLLILAYFTVNNTQYRVFWGFNLWFAVWMSAAHDWVFVWCDVFASAAAAKTTSLCYGFLRPTTNWQGHNHKFVHSYCLRLRHQGKVVPDRQTWRNYPPTFINLANVVPDSGQIFENLSKRWWCHCFLVFQLSSSPGYTDGTMW